LITQITFREAYKLWSSSLCILLRPPATPSLLGQNTLLNTLFSNTVCVLPFSVRDQVSHPHKFIVLYILIFKLLKRWQEDKRLWTKW
jgi:hypothetical protein